MQPQQPNPTSTESSSVNTFSFSQHLSDAWGLFTSNVASLIGLIVISGVTQIILSTVAVGGILFWGMQNEEIKQVVSNITNSNPESILSLPASLWYEFFGWVTLYLIISIILASGFMAAMVRKVGTDTKMGFGESIGKGFSRALPLTLFSILASLLVMGGMVPLVIPGLFVLLFISMAWYELVLTENSILGAVRRSTQMVSSHFGLVLGRTLALVAVSVLLSIVSQGMMKVADFAFWGGMISVLGSYFLSIFSVPYYILLYRFLDKDTPQNTSTNAIWIYLVSIIGLLLLGIVSYFGISKGVPFIREEIKRELAKGKTVKVDSATFPFSVPSSCGVQISLPGTVDKETGKKWIYEERFVNPESMRGMVPESQSNVVGTLIGMVSFKTDAQRIPQTLEPGSSFNTNYPGFNLICTANTEGLTLAQFVKQAQSIDSAKVTLSQETSFGKLATQGIWIEGVNKGGDFYKEPLFLGVTEKGENLFSIKIWSDESEQVTKETNMILDNLTFNKNIKPVQDPSL
mgnify:CR=1 FL=1